MKAAAIACLAVLAGSAPGGPSGSAPPIVVAELFTSEGCSSCPPADALLARLADEQPIEGVQVIALEEHVDYWDNQGWRDPFSRHLFTMRQSAYDARVFHSGDIYTPQLVVDGVLQCVGSDRAAATRAVARAAAAPQAAVRVRAMAVSSGRVSVTVDVTVPAAVVSRRDADVLLAITEDGLTTNVRAGENRGRTLAHGSIVRSLNAIGRLGRSQATLGLTAAVPIDDGWSPARLRIVAFLQERDTGRVIGAGASRLP